MSLNKSEQKKLKEFRKWSKGQVRRYRLTANPRFSLGVDSKTKKILYRYSIIEVVGYDKDLDEPITRRKKKNGYTQVPLDQYELINVRSIQNQIKKDLQKSTKEARDKSENFGYWIDEYVNLKIRNGVQLSESSRKSDKTNLKLYEEWLMINHPKYLDIYRHADGGRQILEEYLLYHANRKTKFGKPPTKNTLNGYYVRIKSFFNYLSDRDPKSFQYNMLRLRGWGQERNKDKLPPHVSTEDMKVLIKWMDANRENKYERHFIPILRILLITGVRISEAVSMRMKDLDLKKKTWSFRTKTKWRTINLDSKTLWEDLEYWIYDDKGKVRKDKKWVFHLEYWRRGATDGKGGGVKMDLDKHITTSGVGSKFKRVILDLGLDPKLTPHSCRRGFATYMLEQTNGDVYKVMNMLGHSSLDMVMRYARQTPPKDRTTINLGEVLQGE